MYSRKERIEERQNKKKTYFFAITSVILVVLFLFLGLPAIAKFASFIADFKKSSAPVEPNDATAPPPPKLDALPEATKQTEIDVKGRSEPGATVLLYHNSESLELLANSAGEFSHSFRLTKGDNVFSAKAVDSSGNESDKTDNLTVIFDDKPPDLAVAKPKDGDTFFGTQQRQITLEGTTEEDVIVRINDRLLVVNNDGSFSFTSTLNEGENTFTVKATDKADNETSISLKVNFSL